MQDRVRVGSRWVTDAWSGVEWSAPVTTTDPDFTGHHRRDWKTFFSKASSHGRPVGFGAGLVEVFMRSSEAAAGKKGVFQPPGTRLADPILGNYYPRDPFSYLLRYGDGRRFILGARRAQSYRLRRWQWIPRVYDLLIPPVNPPVPDSPPNKGATGLCGLAEARSSPLGQGGQREDGFAAWANVANAVGERNKSLASCPWRSKYLLRRYLDPPNLHSSVSNHLLRRYLDP